MMTLDEAKQRLAILKAEADQSAGSHNILLGRLVEMQNVVEFLQNKEKEAATPVKATKAKAMPSAKRVTAKQPKAKTPETEAA